MTTLPPALLGRVQQALGDRTDFADAAQLATALKQARPELVDAIEAQGGFASLFAALRPDGSSGSALAAERLAGRGGGKVVGPGILEVPPSAAKIGKKIQDAIVGIVGKAPGSAAKLPELFALKDAQALKLWDTDPRLMQAVKLGAECLKEPVDQTYLGRATDQNVDLAMFKQVLADDGLLGAPVRDNDAALLESAVWFLDAVWPREIPGARDDQEAAARLVMGSKAALSDFSSDDRERLAAMLCATGGRVHTELLLTDPAAAKAKLQDRTGAELAWLDNPAEFRALADAILILKLADQNRGNGYRAFQSAPPGATPYGVLRDHPSYSGKTVSFYREATRNLRPGSAETM